MASSSGEIPCINTAYRWTMKPAEIPSYYRERGITSSGLNAGPPLKAFTFVNVFTTSREPELFMAAKRTQWRTRNRGRHDETRARVRMESG